MKITTKKYAQALLDSVSEKKQSEIEKIVGGFINALAANNDIKRLDKIIVDFENLWNKKEGIIEAEVKSAHILERDALTVIKKYLEKITGLKKIEIFNKVDKNVLGGVVIKYGDKVLDNSIRARILDLKNNLSK